MTINLKNQQKQCEFKSRRLKLPRMASWLLPLLLINLPFPVHADTSNDMLAPQTSVADALTGPLHTVTIATASLAESLLFYRDGLGLSVSGPIPVDARTRAQQRALWGVPNDIGWDLYLLRRPDAPGAASIRLLVLDTPTPAIHSSWSALQRGPFSMGFPNEDQEALDAKMRRLGFGSLNVIEKYTVPRRDGTVYPIHETIFNGPDFVHAVGIYRGDGMAQLGPVDAATGLGGPAYSAQVVDDSDAMLAFLTEVLGMELRSDRTWKSAGTEGALNVPDGTIFRFSIVYAMGATSGHLLFVDYENVASLSNGVAPRLPNRGIGMWTFPVTDLDEVLRRATDKGIEIEGAPVSVDMPAFGKAKVATVLAPNGFMIELFEAQP